MTSKLKHQPQLLHTGNLDHLLYTCDHVLNTCDKYIIYYMTNGHKRVFWYDKMIACNESASGHRFQSG